LPFKGLLQLVTVGFLVAVARFLAFLLLTIIALLTGFQAITVGFLVAVARFLEF
jgi:hypothetical protein